MDIFVGICRRHPHRLERGDNRILTCCALRRILQQMKGLCYQPPNPMARVERPVRILEDDLHGGAHRCRNCLACDSLLAEVNAARTRCLQAQNGTGQCGLAASGFPDEAYTLALTDRE